MKKVVFALAVACVGLMVRADDPEYIFWQVDPASVSGVSMYDDTRFYAQLGQGDVITLGTLGEYEEVTPSAVSGPFQSLNLVDTLGADRSSYSFWFELLSDNATVGLSETLSYGQLTISTWKTGSEIPTISAMTPSFSAVPEPTSGLLALIGIAGLALRRRKAV